MFEHQYYCGGLEAFGQPGRLNSKDSKAHQHATLMTGFRIELFACLSYFVFYEMDRTVYSFKAELPSE